MKLGKPLGPNEQEVSTPQLLYKSPISAGVPDIFQHVQNIKTRITTIRTRVPPLMEGISRISEVTRSAGPGVGTCKPIQTKVVWSGFPFPQEGSFHGHYIWGILCIYSTMPMTKFYETLLTQRRSEQGLAAYDTNVRTSLGSQLLPRVSHIMSSAFISESLANQRHKPRQRSLVSKNMIGISQLNSRMTPSLSVAQTHQNSSPYTLKKPLLTKQISTTRAQILRNSSQTILDSASRFMAPPNIVTSRQSNYRQQSSRGQTLNNSIDYSQTAGSRLVIDQRDTFIRTLDQQNMRLISHIQMVEREVGEYRANVGRYYTLLDPSNNQLIVEERQEELNELVQNVNEVLEVKRELKRGIRKAKMLLEKQETRENVGDIKNRVKDIVLQVKTLKRELKFKRSQRDEKQGLIDKQAEQLGKVHNLEKVQQKIQKFRMKHKRLEQIVKEKNSGDKQSHVSFIDKIIQQKKLKDQLYQVQRSPKPHITMRDLSLNNRQQYLIRVSQTLEKKRHHLNNSMERAINAQVERLQGKELEIQESQVLIKAKERENLKLKQEIDDLKKLLPEIYEEHSPINKTPKIVITEVPKKPQVPRFRKPLNQYQTSQQNEDLQNLLSEEDHHFDSSRFSSYSAHNEPTALAVDQTRSFLKARRSSRDRTVSNLPEQSFFLTQDDPADIERLQESPLPVYIKPKLKYQVSEDLVINESLADLTQTDQNIEVRQRRKRLDDEERSAYENQSEEGIEKEESTSKNQAIVDSQVI